MALESSKYRMADRLAKGRLAQILVEYKSAGHSYDHVARLLFADHGIEVTRNTVELWTANALDNEPKAAAS